MAIRLKLTKKLKIIIIIIFVLILGGSGAYLLWRTNQPDTVAPTDSEATGGAGACCGPAGCVAGWKCVPTACSETIADKATCVYEPGEGLSATCPAYKGATGVPTKNCVSLGEKVSCKYNIAGTCVEDDSEEGPVEGTCPNKDTCEWPNTLMSSDGCACEPCDGSNGCSGKPPTSCTPPSCPAGYQSCGTSVSNDSDTDSECDKQTTKKCTVYHPDCNNPSNIFRYCKPATSSTNVCDGGEWLTKPTGSYKYCDPITYTAKAKDSDGIDKTSVIAKLNNTARSSVSFINETTTTVDISESLSTTTNCLPIGTYTLNLSWKDKKGASGTQCALTTTFSILAEEQNPSWTITKTGVEQCLEDGDAQVIYTIKIKNIGTGTGSIDKIVDALDSKVLASYITGTISQGGLFGSGNITWELEGAEETFAADQEKIYTYTLIIPKTAFGKYTNTATAYPTTGENFFDSVEVTVDCIQDIPQTGLFDSTIIKIVAGIVLLLLGFNLQKVDTGFKRMENSLNKLSISIQDTQSERRKRNFEKKIVKK